MKPARRTPHASPDDPVADEFCTAIRALGDYAHVTVRAQRGLLYVHADDPKDAVARFHPLGHSTYGLSVHITPVAGSPCPSPAT